MLPNAAPQQMTEVLVQKPHAPAAAYGAAPAIKPAPCTVLSLYTALLLSACAVGPNFTPPAPVAAPAATAQSAAKVLTSSGRIDAPWWRSFGDNALNELEERVLAGNLDLAEAGARIGRARAALRIAGASGLPRAGAAASYMRERASPEGILSLIGDGSPAPDSAGGAAPFGTTTLEPSDKSGDYDLFQAGFDASWELDFWGKARRTREASRSEAQAAFLDREAARISLSAEVARTYMRLRGAEARLIILRSNRQAVVAGQRIADERQRRGAATRYDAATAGTQVAAIDAELPAVERDAAVARNALASLAGAEPHALDSLLAGETGAMPAVGGSMPSALPSDLARSRPDILAAESALHAATARIGMAKADFYPSVSLSGSFGLQSLALNDLPSWGARQFVVGPILHLPIFEGGQIKGRLELAQADQQVAAIRYRATVLRAWHEIDDALEELRTSNARLKAAEAGVEQSRIAAHVSERRYHAGASGYLDVLVAERARLEREGTWVTARADHAIALTALYKALGGGWTPPTTPKVAGS